MAVANQISDMLNQVLGIDRFPVDVQQLALEYTNQCFPDSPITKIQGERIDGFEGMLKANKSKTKWLIVYNDGNGSEGRQRFTVAHEFGHYMVHRELQDEFACHDDEISTGERSKRDIETEADQFASTLLMPYDDFRRQVNGQTVSFDLIGHCADRYGVSLTAAALRWIDIAPERAILIASRDDHMLWAKSNEDAFKSRAYFATRKNVIELPRTALAHSANAETTVSQQDVRANTWLANEPGYVLAQELVKSAGQYDYKLTLLLLPQAEWRRPAHEDEEPDEDTFDRFTRNGQPLNR
ncbi:ImmA/IrrE family metallo-endopeptidase [Limnohabitans sp. Hippo4]|uniref:ImmA/IrrE family metallo-endopeptidase n=1 Tax=Limnohabitans sp. Hippo4 TaxID=1826167 RepID=UPI001E2B16D2|nr:ImmA/IrrE family metallo-endopeptidase [Limnohabitans sp. Hippo4]